MLDLSLKHILHPHIGPTLGADKERTDNLSRVVLAPANLGNVHGQDRSINQIMNAHWTIAYDKQISIY